MRAGAAVICQQLQQRNGQIVAGPPKTPHSTRVIALDRNTVTALRAHKERQRAERAAHADRYRDSGYVFTNRDGDPIAPGWLTHIFQRLIAEHDVPPIRLHDLRHGAATLALAAGVELKVVQEMLGHCSIVLTADTYTSVFARGRSHRGGEDSRARAARRGRGARHRAAPLQSVGSPTPSRSPPRDREPRPPADHAIG